MKIIRQNPILSGAIALSVLLHVGLLLVRFANPDAFKPAPINPDLEVIVVNSKHDKKPVKAQALAQANLDGGGNADDGRATSPLPDMNKVEDGENVEVTQQRHVEELQEQQEKLSQLVKQTSFTTAPSADKDAHATPVQDGQDKTDNARKLALATAEILNKVNAYNSRPKTTNITPSTREVGYARYYNAMKGRIEKFGTVNFPQKNGKQLYGKLLVYVPVYQDGSIYEGDGGPRIEHSSNNPALDAAALRIVRHAAPFGHFPSEMRTSKNEVWGMIYSFKFTRDEGLTTELRGDN